MRVAKVITRKLAHILEVLLVAALLVSSAAAALAFDVIGTVSNPTGKTGRIYLSVQSATFGGGTPVAGISIPAAGTYTIRGLTDAGSYQVSAFLDTQQTGVRHANNPIATSATFTNASPTGVNLSLANPATVALLPPNEANVIYGDTTATIFYKGASDNNGNPIATSYNIYWSTTLNPGPTNTTGGGSFLGVPSGAQDFFAKTGLANPASQYNFAITSILDGVESTPVNANVAPATSGVIVSGTVTTSGITLPLVSPAQLLMVLMDQGAGRVLTFSLPDPVNSQAFSFNGVPPGSYTLYSILDLNNNGLIDLGDIADTEVGVPVTVGGSDVPGIAVTLAAADARPYVQTKHYPGNTYALNLGAVSMMKRPVNVSVTGPQIPVRDLGLSNNGIGSFETWQNVASRPNFPTTPDNYSFVIEYSSGSGSTPLSAAVTGIVDYFATPTAPVGVITLPAPDPLQFSWTAPAPGPAYPYTYSFWLNNPNGYFNNDPYRNLSSATTSINIPAKDFVPAMGFNYNWNINLKDSFGNSSESQASFSTGLPGSISGKVTRDGFLGITSTYAVLLDAVSGNQASGIVPVLTDSVSGAYTIANIPPGNYKLYFSAGPGYQSEFYNQQFTFNNALQFVIVSNDNRTNIDATLTPALNSGTIVGQVLDATTGLPVFNALVELYSTTDVSLGNSVTTMSNGSFQLSAVQPGSYKLKVSANGYRTSLALNQYLVQTGVTTQATVNLPPIPSTVTYRSKVQDRTGTAVSGALVTLAGTATSVTTDVNGFFSITVPSQTLFYVQITNSGFVTTNSSMVGPLTQDSDTSERPYTLYRLTDTDIATWYSQAATTQTAGTGTISGRIVSSSNQLMTLPGATVTTSAGTLVCNFSATGIGTCSPTSIATQPNGRFVVLNVPGGTQVTVSASKTGYGSDSKVYPVVADEVTLGRVALSSLSTGYSYTGKLVDTSGNPVVGDFVTLMSESSNTLTPNVAQTATDSNGQFTFSDLLPGSPYLFKFNSVGSTLLFFSANFSVGMNVDGTLRPYTLYPQNQLTTWLFGTTQGVITGTVMDSLTGTPLAGAAISAAYAGGSSIITIMYDNGSGPVVGSSTGTNGKFYIYGLSLAANNKVVVTAAPPAGYVSNTKGYHIYSPATNFPDGLLAQGNIYLNPSSATMITSTGSVSERLGLPLAGAKVSAYTSLGWILIGNPSFTDSSGNFALNVPANTNFALAISDNGYRTAYTQNINLLQNSFLSIFSLLTSADYSLLGWPLTAGKSFVRGMAVDNLFRPLSGAIVTPSSFPSRTYTVQYVNDSDNRTLVTGGSTFTNGLFVLKDATPGDIITLQAAKAGSGLIFNPVGLSHVVADTDSLALAFDNTNPAPGNFGFPAPAASFGGINLASPSQQSITLFNNGPSSISISSFNLTGNTGDFSILPGGSCSTATPVTFNPGSCTLMIGFTPTTLGSRSATLTLTSNASSGTTYSIALSGTGLATTPSAPAIYAVNPWDGQATVNFNPPTFDGGSPITGYRLTGTPGPITVSVPAPANQITVTGLTNGITYAFWVAAINATGTGPDSSPAANGTPFYAPLRIGTTGYNNNIQTLLGIAPAGSLITAQAGPTTVTTSPLNVTQAVTIAGGYNSTYSAVNDYTVIPGRLNIRGSAFKVVFKNVKVK